MTTIRNIALLLTLSLLAGCTSTTDETHSVPGTVSTVSGIDIWKDGAPSRPYLVIDTVEKQAADSSANFAQEEQLLAADAKERGADAMIIVNEVMVPSRMSIVDGRLLLAPKVTAELIKYQ